MPAEGSTSASIRTRTTALAAFGALGALILWRGGLFGADFGAVGPRVAWTLWGLGALSAVFSLLAPQANRALYVGLAIAAYPIGLVVSYAIMGLLFYGMITPFGLVFRIVRRDSLKRRYDPQAQSYWVDARAPRAPERYFRQF